MACLSIMQKKSQCQDVTLFHTIDDWEGLCEFSDSSNIATLVLCCWIIMFKNSGRQLNHSIFCHIPFFSLCQVLSSYQQILYTAPCFAQSISFRAVGEQTPSLWCSSWLWSHTGCLGGVLHWWWVPVCSAESLWEFFSGMESKVIPR